MDPLSVILDKLSVSGPLGLVAAVLLYALWQKDRALASEKDGRIADAKAYTDLALKLQSSVLDAVHKVADIVDALGRKP